MLHGCHGTTRRAVAAAGIRVRRFGSSMRAQSDTIGVVALAAVALVLAAGIGVFLFSDLTGDDERDPVIVSVDSSVTSDRLTIGHDSGNVLDPEQVSVLVDGNQTEGRFALASSPEAGPEFAAGDSWLVGPGLNLTGQFRVVVVHDPTNAILHEATYTVDGGPVPAESLLSGLDVAGQGADATVAEGESGDVAVDVTNVGTENASFDVTLAVDSAVTRSQSTADLAGGDSETVTFAGVTSGLDPGSYGVTVETDNDSVAGTLTVTEPPETLDSALAYGLANQSAIVRDRNQSDWPVTADLDSADGAVRALAWSPDGARLAYGPFDSDGTVYIINGSDWTVERTLDDASDRVLSLAWSPDGSRVAYGSSSGTVHVHETAGWTREATLDAASGRILSVTWAPDSSQLAYGASSGVYVHDAGGSWSVAATPGGSSIVDAVAWSPDDDSLAAGNLTGDISVYDTNTWSREARINETDELVHSLAWAPDGSQLASGTGTDDETVYVHEATGWTRQQTLTQPGGRVEALAWTADDSRLLAGSADGTLHVYETTGYTVARTLTAGPGNGVRSIALLSE